MYILGVLWQIIGFGGIPSSEVLVFQLRKANSNTSGRRRPQIQPISDCRLIAKASCMYIYWYTIMIARLLGPTWGPSGADKTQVGPMLELCNLGTQGSVEIYGKYIEPSHTNITPFWLNLILPKNYFVNMPINHLVDYVKRHIWNRVVTGVHLIWLLFSMQSRYRICRFNRINRRC